MTSDAGSLGAGGWYLLSRSSSLSGSAAHFDAQRCHGRKEVVDGGRRHAGLPGDVIEADIFDDCRSCSAAPMIRSNRSLLLDWPWPDGFDGGWAFSVGAAMRQTCVFLFSLADGLLRRKNGPCRSQARSEASPSAEEKRDPSCLPSASGFQAAARSVFPSRWARRC